MLVVLLLITCSKALATVFVVTSNADAGAGTLRDALSQAAANGSITKDFIHFNLADLSDAGRTITILTDLPTVSSNLVIDASTQPGTKFGVSDAKIKLIAVYNPNGTVTCCFNISNQHDVEFYGFLMDSMNLTLLTQNAIAGITGSLVQKAIIGAPGKGNITKNLNGITLTTNLKENDLTISRNIKISSNILGLNEDGETIAPNMGISLSATRVRNLKLGGETPAEGNIFAGQVDYSEANINLNFFVSTDSLTLSNNLFGTNNSGTKGVPNLPGGAALAIFGGNLKYLAINRNQFVSSSYISMAGVRCFFYITGNKFGTDKTGKNVLGTFQNSILISYCGGGGIIGGPAADANVFSGAYSNAQGAVDTQGGIIINIACPGVEVAGNSFSCNYSTFPYQVTGLNFSKYFVTVDNRSSNALTGTATPNSRVDLFYSLSCDHCEPEKLFATVTTDANGNWVYNGALTDHNIIASATYQKTTSEFTSIRFTNKFTDVKVKMACGGNNGSISGFTTSVPVKYNWYNAAGQAVGTTANLDNAPPGKYHLIINDGYCSVTSPDFTIDALPGVVLDEQHVVITKTTCAGNASVTGLTATGANTTIWTNDVGNVVSTQLDLINITGGKYTLTVDDICGNKVTRTYDLGSPPLAFPVFKSTIIRSCSTTPNGSLSVTGDASVKAYRWVNSKGQNAGNAATVNGLPAGDYQLYLTGQGGCEAFYQAYTIDAIPPVNIGTAQITADQCGLKTGSIKGIPVSGGIAPYTYAWLNADNKIISNALTISGIGSGTYTLQVTDASGCGTVSAPFTVPDQSDITSPTVSNIVVCSAGPALLQVANPLSTCKYVLYGSRVGSSKIDEQANGVFNIMVSGNTSYFISAITGTCESARTEVKVTIGEPLLHIANAFTPNGDGINDYWQIKGIESYPAALIRVFNRYGQQVFESKGYNRAFEGVQYGTKLPNGVYYYMIYPGTGCNMVSGNLTIVR